MSLLRLRAHVAKAAETLRSYDPRFAAEKPELGELRPSGLVEGVQEQSIRVVAQGRVTEPLARDLPGVGLEKYVLSPDELVEALEEHGSPELAARVGELLAGYHRAHLVGPGFGTELYEGLMLAPAEVNLKVQNEGVERFIRSLAAGGADVDVRTVAVGRRLVLATESVDILKTVSYTIRVKAYAKSAEYHVDIQIGDPPDGEVQVKHDLPDAAGPDILEALS
jgi:hypothetical protein